MRELLNATTTLPQCSSEYEVYPHVLRAWKMTALNDVRQVVERRDSISETKAGYERKSEELNAEICRQTTYVNYLE